ncbi:phytanoyl-CoA dioxygenase family protein [Chitinophaga sp. CB10]|uniref:phytanoyl-CoA dioxygenase family protein n=1 Tax=Chitinophaga sp. CB10 TaxID=1891659 RepID=UPI000AB9C662|nr:phytanoyl-CoA dioxygenase family protein [Chitinophaga sp. CB10]
MISYQHSLAFNGFAIVPFLYTAAEIQAILSCISQADSSRETFRKTSDLFAIRQFLKEVPEVLPLLLNDRFKSLLQQAIGHNCFVVKSIYFDKPAASNWYVSYHQDLTISVNQKAALPGFGPWTVKTNQFAVQPPLPYLENITTLRIHLDDTTAANGALKVIPGSHAKGIYRPETINRDTETEVHCEVPAGGAMLMKPLLLHSSGRTTNQRQRRVLHIEFASMQLPDPLAWSEKLSL